MALMMEYCINKGSGCNSVHEILKGRWCTLGELTGKQWKNAMELDNLMQKVVEVSIDYSDLQTLYTRDGREIIITVTRNVSGTEFGEDRRYIGIRRIPGDSYSLLTRGNLPRLVELEKIEPILNTEIIKMVS